MAMPKRDEAKRSMWTRESGKWDKPGMRKGSEWMVREGKRGDARAKSMTSWKEALMASAVEGVTVKVRVRSG